jgi:hypothetical protein
MALESFITDLRHEVSIFTSTQSILENKTIQQDRRDRILKISLSNAYYLMIEFYLRNILKENGLTSFFDHRDHQYISSTEYTDNNIMTEIEFQEVLDKLNNIMKSNLHLTL